MAIDTALKRWSFPDRVLPWRGRWPFPDGANTASDRYTRLGLYSGLVAAAPQLLEAIGNISAGSDTGTHQYDLSVYFTGQTSYSIAPAVELGWSFDTNTGILEIDTDADATFGPYTVTATNGSGNTDSNAFTVRVSAGTASLYEGLSLRSPFELRF